MTTVKRTRLSQDRGIMWQWTRESCLPQTTQQFCPFHRSLSLRPVLKSVLACSSCCGRSPKPKPASGMAEGRGYDLIWRVGMRARGWRQGRLRVEMATLPSADDDTPKTAETWEMNNPSSSITRIEASSGPQLHTKTTWMGTTPPPSCP